MSPQSNIPNQNNIVMGVEPSFATKLFASALFSGYSPVASGTVGSAVALAFYFIPGFESLVFIGAFILIVFILGIPYRTTFYRRALSNYSCGNPILSSISLAGALSPAR